MEGTLGLVGLRHRADLRPVQVGAQEVVGHRQVAVLASLEQVVAAVAPEVSHGASIGVRGGAVRSEERRVGKECVSKCGYRWEADYHRNKIVIRASVDTRKRNTIQS